MSAQHFESKSEGQSESDDRLQRRANLEAFLREWLNIPGLCQICIEYSELPLNQLWIFIEQKQLVQFNPKTSEIQTYPFERSFPLSGLKPGRPAFPSLWNLASFWNRTDPRQDFILWAQDSLRFGTLVDGKLQVKMDSCIKFSDDILFSFTFQNQFYTIGFQSYVWKNPKEQKEIPIVTTHEDNGAAWIVHNECLYKFGVPKGKVSTYSLRSFTPTFLPCKTSARANCSLTLHPDSQCIFISGGFSAKGKVLKTIEIFDTKTQKLRDSNWMMPKPFWDHYSFCFNHFYFLVGRSDNEFGCTENTEIWKHALNTEGVFLGEWILVTSFPGDMLQQECLFG